jgi:hypothetical protein
MKSILAGIIFAVLLGGAIVSAQQPSEVLTNVAVIKLVRAGFKEKTLIAIIRSRPNRFDLSADQLVELKRNHVTEDVILAMLSYGGWDYSASDDLSDDNFFKGGMETQSDPRSRGQKDEGTSIFGSGGSGKSQSQVGRMKGGNEGDTQTTGGATVRILRPPTEGGAAAAKLERTPTLTNDSVIQLVEAGFSEGTIVKRIELSPVEFDLSAQKLVELRKRRVSETIIAAMTTAMSDTPTPRAATPEKSREN